MSLQTKVARSLFESKVLTLYRAVLCVNLTSPGDVKAYIKFSSTRTEATTIARIVLAIVLVAMLKLSIISLASHILLFFIYVSFRQARIQGSATVA